MLDLKEFGMRMVEGRKTMRMTQEALGELIGMSAGGVSAIECAVNMPDLELAVTIADALRVDLEWLCGYQDMMRRADSMEW